MADMTAETAKASAAKTYVLDLADPLVDLRDVVVRPQDVPRLDARGIEVAAQLAELIDDPQVDRLLELVRLHR